MKTGHYAWLALQSCTFGKVEETQGERLFTYRNLCQKMLKSYRRFFERFLLFDCHVRIAH